MNKPHKHAEVIKAWADGAQVETRVTGHHWYIQQRLQFDSNTMEYRIHDPLREFKEAYARGENVEVLYPAGYKSARWYSFDEYFCGSELRIAPKPDYTAPGIVYASPAQMLSIGVKVTVLFDGATNKPKSVELVK